MSFSEWKEIKLGDVAEVLSGYAFKTKDFVETGIPVVKIKNIVPPVVDISDTQYVSEDLYRDKIKYSLEFNDILISMTGSHINQFASAVGKIGRVKLLDQKLLLNQRVGKLYIKDPDRCNQEYLYYFLTQDNIRYDLAASAGGSANQANISPQNIRDIDIMLPPLAEQKAIANILSSLDEKIELNNQMNKTLEEMAQALFKRWFVDFEFPNEDGEPYRSGGGEMVNSELGMIPKGWKVNKISDLIEVRDGTHASPKPVKEGYPLVTSKHMNGDRLTVEQANLISEKDYIEVNKRSQVDTGDILISMIGTVGLVYFIQEEKIEYAIKNIGLFKTSKKEEIRELLYLYLKSAGLKNYIEARLAGTTQKYISLGELRNIPIVIPTDEILVKFKGVAKSILDTRRNNIVENEVLVRLRDTLLPKLMSGEIRVTDLQN